MRTKYTIYNSIASLIFYFITIIIGLVNRKCLITLLGIEYQGINGLFSNVLSMLSIAELGIGITIIYHLYRPLAEHDTQMTKCLMAFYKKCYNVIALVVAGCGLLFIPFLPYFVPDYSLPQSLNQIYIWFLLDSVCSYLFTYKRSILIADQKNYIVTFCDILYQLTSKLGQVAVLLVTENFILYLITMVICRLAENFLLNFLVLWKYPFLKEKTEDQLPAYILEDIKKKVKGTIFHKMGSFFVLGVDNILISRFFGLAVVGIYSNYQLIINTLKNVAVQFVTAATAGVGHLLVEKDEEKNYGIFCQLQLVNAGIVNFSASGLFCVVTPLIQFIFGEELVFSDIVVFSLAVKFYITGMRQVYAVFKEAAGILYEDRFIPLIESALNVVASLVCLHFFGVIGVFIGTIISSFALFGYTYPVLVYKGLLKRTIKEYSINLLHLTAIAVLSMIVSYLFVNTFYIDTLFIRIIFNCLVCCIIPNFLFYLLYARRKSEWQELLTRIQKRITR